MPGDLMLTDAGKLVGGVTDVEDVVAESALNDEIGNASGGSRAALDVDRRSGGRLGWPSVN